MNTLFHRALRWIRMKLTTGLAAALGVILWWPAAGRADPPTAVDFGYGHLQAPTSRFLLVIVARFGGDTNMNINANYWDQWFFGTNSRNIRAYFSENSCQRFAYVKAGVLPVDLPESARFFSASVAGNENTYYTNIIYQAMAANSFNIDSFDANGVGGVTDKELAIVVLNNDQAAAMRTITSSVKPPASTKSWVGPLVAATPYDSNELTACHELSHLLGALDLYGSWARPEDLNTRLTAMNNASDPGDFFHLDPWHKMEFGWNSPRILSLAAGGRDTLPATQFQNIQAPILLYDPVKGTNEYFLLEYRTTNCSAGVGYDANVAGSGLVIWHVRQDAANMPLWLTDAAMTGNTQTNWWYCKNCKGLYYASGSSACPAAGGGPHVGLPGVGEYRLSYDNSAAPGQRDWRWCSKCYGMYFGFNQATSVCPKSGTHSGTSSDYVLNNSGTNFPYEVKEWRWCNKCQGLFYGPDMATSVCPKDGAAHDSTGSGNYGLAQRFDHYALAAKGAPDLRYAGHTVWTGGMTTPELQWYNGSNTHVRVKVHTFLAGADSITVEWLGDTETWVDFNFTGSPELGTFDAPYNTFAEGVFNVARGGTLRMKTGHHYETNQVIKPMTIRGYNGPASVGR